MNKKTAALVILCCLIPLAGLVAILLLRVPVSSVVLFGMLLLCPLLHLVMMGTVGRGHAHSGHDLNPMPRPGPEKGRS
ncbi:MAG: DUF2933 domain-containing protein [Chloroflexota bacterium]